VTPFKDGKVDEDAFRGLVNWQVEEGVHGLVPVGTTGESPTLSHQEHDRVVEICVQETKGRVPVIAGAGSNSTAEAVAFSRNAEKVGADALLIVTPYYNKPTQEGLYHHYKAINDAVGIPIVIYNIPGRSVIDMSVDTMARLFELKNIVGVKDATGSVARITQQRVALGPDFIQLSGDDIIALPSVAVGALGTISVVSNVAPRLSADRMNAALAGDVSGALALQDRLAPLDMAIFLEPGVAGAKAGLAALGRMQDEVRLPLTSATEPTRKAIRSAMIHAGLLNA
jgi:4-hydroxy-tetrahydrodipicolinate synthase